MVNVGLGRMLDVGLKTMLDFGCWILDDGFLMEFSIQHLKFKILPWSQGFSEVVLTMEVRIF
jgi:hypothetical protein